ncbi:unnamed protein product [Parajaminaea phylloscopi]
MPGVSHPRRRRRLDPLALAGAAGAAVALAGAAWYWWNQSRSSGDDTSPGPSSARPSDRKAQLARRPTLSLVLPPSLPLQHPTTCSAVSKLLRTLAPLYLVHLIYPDVDESSVDALQDLLDDVQDIEGVDTRRFLAYEKPQGAEAIARALGCDMHVEVLAQGSPNVSAASHGDLLRRSQALGLIRRNGKCRLFVVLLLPPPEALVTTQPGHKSASSTILGSNHSVSGDPADELVSAMLNAAGDTAQSGLATLRVIDTRSKAGSHSPRDRIDLSTAIDDAANRLAAFRSGWK